MPSLKTLLTAANRTRQATMMAHAVKRHGGEALIEIEGTHVTKVHIRGNVPLVVDRAIQYGDFWTIHPDVSAHANYDLTLY